MGSVETWRGIERCLIVIGAIIFAYLGYLLYLSGVENMPVKLDMDTGFLKFALSGGGPGILFMAFGGTILIWALKSRMSKQTLSDVQKPDITVNQKHARQNRRDNLLIKQPWDPSTVTRVASSQMTTQAHGGAQTEHIDDNRSTQS